MAVEPVRKVGLCGRLRAFYTGGLGAGSGDGETIYTPVGGCVAVVDAKTGKERCRLGQEEEEGTSEVTALALHPNNTQLVVAYRNLLLKLWDLQTEKVERTWRSGHKGPILSLGFGRSGEDEWRLGSGGADFLTRVWDLERQYATHHFPGTSGVISALAFASTDDGEILFVGSGEGEVRAFALGKGGGEAAFTALPPTGMAITCLLAQGNDLVACDRKGLLHWWSRGGQGECKELETGGEGLEWMAHPHSLPQFQPAQLGRAKKVRRRELVVICCGSDGTLSAWDLGTQRQLYSHQLLPPGQGGLSQIVSCPDSESFIVFTGDQNIFWLSGDSLTVQRQMVGHNDEVLSLCVVGSSLIAATNSPLLRLYDLEDLSCRLLHGHSDTVLALARAGPSRFLSSSKDNTARLWEVGRGWALCLAVARGHTNNLTALAVAPAKARFMVTGSDDMTLKLWDLSEGFKMEEEVEDKSATVPHEIHAVATTVAHQKGPGVGLTCVGISPNDKVVASGSLEKTVKLWHVNWKGKGGELSPGGSLSAHTRGVWDLCFSPSDQVIATASGDCILRIFSLTDLTCVKTFEGHQSAVLTVAFLSEGLQLVSTDTGGILKLWSIRKGECVQTEEAHEDKAWALHVPSPPSPALLLATAGADSDIKLWRNVTEEERRKTEEEHQLKVGQEQTLSNLLVNGDFTQALKLSLEMERPMSAFNVLNQMDDEEMRVALGDLSDHKMGKVVEYVVGWNSRIGNAEVAQRVLFILLSITPPQNFLALPNAKELLGGLLPYTERHFQRLSRLQQTSHFLRFTKAQISL